MKLFTNLKSGLLKAAFVLLLAAPAAVSCYDDSGLQEQIDMLIDKVYELEQRLNNELSALQAMLKGNAMISSVSTDTDGVTTIKLTDGTELSLYPKADMEAFITYMQASVNGEMVDCWAYIDDEGIKRFMRDADGNPIPVAAETPEVVEIDGESYLMIGGETYPLSGNSVFSDYVLHTDELTGEVYAVTFTFGEGMTFTVTVDGACGFYFVQSAGWSTSIVSDWYVANGLTERVQVEARGVVDYVLQIPDGWRVKEYEDVYMGGLYFDITAPSKELVESGVVAAEGDLKVVAVLEGGKATVARLYLTTEPFKTFGVSLGNVKAQMYSGLQKFVYGVCAKDQFDEAAILETATGLLTAYDYPAGYGLSSGDIFLPVEDVLGSEPVAGESYVFWALPALYFQTADDAGYYLAEGTFETCEFKYSSIDFEISDEKFRDATLTMEVKGADAYYMQLVRAEDYMIEDVLYGLNAGYYEAKSSPMTYTGSLFTFAGVTAEAATGYVAWIALAQAGKTYTEDDVIVREFSTLKLEAGGTVAVTAGEMQAAALEVKVPLTAEGAEAIYYAFMTTSDAKKYADDEAKATYLLENGKNVRSVSAEAKLSDFIAKPKPATDYVLLAVASDSEGKYGVVLTMDCSTTEIIYNDLKVELELAANDPGNVVINIASEGAEGFLYWIGKTSDNTWKSSNYLGGSAANAEVYMNVNPTHSRLETVMANYPVVDGKITLKDLTTGVEHVIVAMAKSVDGTYSHAVEMKFTTRTVALGNVVMSTDSRWEAARPTVEYIQSSFYPSTGMMSGGYSANVTIPLGYTGYVLLGTDNYITGGVEGLVLEDVPTDDAIVAIIGYADVKRDVGLLVDDEAWTTQGYPYGYQFYTYQHGSPAAGSRPGAAVIWGSEEFHASRCHCVEEFESRKVISGVEMDIELVVLINDGNPVMFSQPDAVGSTSEVVDKVFVVCQDADGNCYEPFVFDVPFEYFRDATGGRQ